MTSSLQEAVEAACRDTGASQAILVVRDASGLNAMAFTRVASHQDAVLLLASASHMVLLSHDEAVMAGSAGDEALRVALLARDANAS